MPCARDHICSLALRICLSVNNLSRHGWFGSGCAYKEQLGGLHLCKQHIYIWCRLAQLTLFGSRLAQLTLCGCDRLRELRRELGDLDSLEGVGAAVPAQPIQYPPRVDVHDVARAPRDNTVAWF